MYCLPIHDPKRSDAAMVVCVTHGSAIRFMAEQIFTTVADELLYLNDMNTSGRTSNLDQISSLMEPYPLIYIGFPIRWGRPVALARSLLDRVGRQWGAQKKYALFGDYLWLSGKALPRAAAILWMPAIRQAI